MIVTIDGPAGAGKSTVARQLARELGFRYLNTGAMYRAVVWAALEAGVPLDDTQRLARFAADLQLALEEDQVRVDGRSVSASQLAEARVTQSIHFVADHPGIRQRMVELQRALARGHDVVTEGRDQGTVAFPDADCKVYLEARPAERAKRRYEQIRGAGVSGVSSVSGVNVDEQEILREIEERDRRDQQRPTGALRKADDAVSVATDGLSVEQVVARLRELVESRQTLASDPGRSETAHDPPRAAAHDPPRAAAHDPPRAAAHDPPRAAAHDPPRAAAHDPPRAAADEGGTSSSAEESSRNGGRRP